MHLMARFFILLTFLLSACESTPPQQETTQPTTPQSEVQEAQQNAKSGIFNQKLTAHTIELASDALPLWRQYREQKPALVVMSYDPFLEPISDETVPQVKELILTGSDQELRNKSGFYRAETLLLSTQAVSAAIGAELFSEIIWLFPSKQGPEGLSLDKFREQMLKAGFLSPTEVAQLRLDQATFSGSLRGIPFRAVHHLGFEKPAGPALLHIDLSFFDGLYDNEVSTPLYTLLSQTANRLRQQQWSPLATSLSYSTLEGVIALESRFLLSNLAELLGDPTLLDQQIPQSWDLRGQALYAADMFTEAKKFELFEQAAALAPNDPTAIYDLFQAHLKNKRIAQALEALDKAAQLDRGYAAGYLAIANMAQQDGNLQATLDFLNRADNYFPENPFIDIGRAELLLTGGEKAAAIEILTGLQQLSWSPYYHAAVPQQLQQLLDRANNSEEQENE